MTAPAFDVEGRLVGRRAELARLAEVLESAGRRGGACVLLSGVPGVGKSTLLQAFGADIVRRGGVFAYGRFQEGTGTPYSALGEALRALVRAMETTGRGERDQWRADLRRCRTSMAGVLETLVSGLDEVLDATPAVTDLEAADGRNRLHRAAVRLVASTARYRPLVVAIDDLQRADEDSLLFVSELVTAAIRNVVFVGAHRAGEFDGSAVELAAASVVRIALQPLGPGELAALLAQACGPAAELPDVATEFQHRTGGNPLQVRQLLQQAQRSGAVRQLDDGRTAWDLRALASLTISANVAELLGQAIDQLRPADRAVLSALACIGREFDLADAVAAAGWPPEGVTQALWAALDLRLLEAVDARGRRITQVIDHDARYRFSHDRVAETARARLSGDAEREVHLEIGRRLLDLGDEQLFEAARHLGIGALGPAVDDAERTRVAEVQLRAAELARRQASFPVALSCCRAGLALLGERPWAAHFALTRALHLGAAEASYLVGDMASLASLLDKAERMLSEAADRARIAVLRLRGLVAQHRLQDALSAGWQALDELGEPLPRRPGKAHLAAALLRSKLTMRRWNDERLLAHRPCHDQRVIEIQRLLDEVGNVAFFVLPELIPLVVRRQLELSLAHGLAPHSVVAIANYGAIVVIAGDLVGGQRFGEVARRLAERAEFRDAWQRTVFLHVNFIRHFRHPMREGLPELRDAFQHALDRGDPSSAGALAAALLYQSFWAGRPLYELDALAQLVIPEIRGNRATSYLCRCIQQFCLNLMGRSDDPFLLAGESGYDEREMVPEARRENDVVALCAVAIIKLSLHFWCGDDAGALPLAEETARYVTGLAGTSNVHFFHMVNALSRVRVSPRDPATARAVREALTLHRKWAAASPANYAAPYEIIAGVWARAQGDLGRAEQHLHAAIALAERNQLPLMSGLAHEEAGALCAQTGREAQSRRLLHVAHQKWLSLGMVVRSDRLERTHPWLVSADLVHAGSATAGSAGIRRLMLALPAASTLESLAEILLGTVLDTTGAVRALLLTGAGDRLVVRAERESDATTTIDPSGDVSHDRSIVAEAVQSGRPLVASAVLAVPVRMRDRTIGVVYAEHHGPGRGFDTEHEVALVALCAQAAAPLWSLELEGKLQEVEEQRQTLIDVQSRFIPSELLRILDIDDISRVRRGHRVERSMTVLISDIRGYTALLEDMNVSDASDMAIGFLQAVEMPIVASNGLLQDVRGDEVLAVFEAAPDDAVRAGLAMLRSLGEHNAGRVSRGAGELRVGIGVNSGTVALGLVGGVNRMALTVIGDAVNLASRVESTNKRYGSSLLISEETHVRLVDPDQFCIRRMERTPVVNRRQRVTIYEVYDEDPEPLRAAKRSAQPAFDEAFSWLDAEDVERARVAFERCRELLPDDQVAPLNLRHCDELAGDRLEPSPS